MGALLEQERCKADALEAAGIVSSIRKDLVEAQGTSAAFEKSSTRSHNAHETMRDEVEAMHQEIQEMQQQTMHGRDSQIEKAETMHQRMQELLQECIDGRDVSVRSTSSSNPAFAKVI